MVLQAIHGPDGRDRSVAADPFHWEPRRPLGAMRVGVLQKAFDNMRAAEKPVYAQALADLKKAGVTATAVDFDENLPPIRFLLEAEGAAAFDDITRDGEIRTLKGQTAGSWPNTFRSSRLVPAVEYIPGAARANHADRAVREVMADWDAIVIPPSALLTTTKPDGQSAGGHEVRLCGRHAAGRLEDQVPAFIGFVGKIYDEGSPLRIALAYERATPWSKMNPAL